MDPASLIKAALLAILEPAMQAIVIAIVTSVPGLLWAVFKLVLSIAGSHAEATKQGALARLAEMAGRAAEQLVAVIQADPTAHAAIEAAKAQIVERMATEASATLRKIGGSVGGVEQLILGRAAAKLRDMGPLLSPSESQGYAAAMGKIAGLLPVSTVPAFARGAL